MHASHQKFCILWYRMVFFQKTKWETHFSLKKNMGPLSVHGRMLTTKKSKYKTIASISCVRHGRKTTFNEDCHSISGIESSLFFRTSKMVINAFNELI